MDVLRKPTCRSACRHRLGATLLCLLLSGVSLSLNAAVALRSGTPLAQTTGTSLGTATGPRGQAAGEPLLAAARGDSASPTLSGLKSAWLDRGRPNSNAYQLIDAIRASRIHGLDPQSYGLDRLQTALRRFDGETDWQNDIDSREVLREWKTLETALQEAFIALASDLARGVVDARAVQQELYRDPPPVPREAWLLLLQSGRRHVQDILVEAMPSHRQYWQLLAAMERLLEEYDQGHTRVPITHLGALDGAAQGRTVRAVRQRLVASGDLDAAEGYYPWFDAGLTHALRQFQTRHGIEASGDIDAPTRALLNRHVLDDIRAVSLSLERWRWLPRDPGAVHIFVNLPSYRLEMFNGEQRIANMPVVIGSEENRTPEFSQAMSYLDLNPTWTVPKGIAEKELLPREAASPGYLRSRQFEYVEFRDGSWQPRANQSLTAEEIAARPFPYMLRQKPGPQNALGRMKFMMPNPHAIYLHDTQAQQHFALPKRAFSHGCIRLSDPDRLASLVLQLDGRSTVEATMILQRKQTTRVRLDSPIPVHLAYLTAEADADGRLSFHDDVYAQDASLDAALRGANTLLSHLPAAPPR